MVTALEDDDTDWRRESPPAGHLVDIHSHLLPGIDDGCQTLAESIECIRQLKAAGFRGTICTPHVIPPTFPNNIPAIIRARVADLRHELARAGIDYELWDGGELRLEADTITWCIDYGVPTLGESRCVLVDTWDYLWPEYCTRTLEWLIRQGYQPILAHPERMELEDHDLEAVYQLLGELGVPLQGNTNSIAGGESARALRRARTLLERGQYSLLALDMHRPDKLPSRLKGIEAARKLVGAAAVDQMLGERPLALAQGGDLPWLNPAPAADNFGA